MRGLMLLPLCLVAACSGGGAEKKAEEAKAPATLPTGQWETSFETESIRSTDKTEPALKAAAGDKETGGACVAEGEEPADIFAGPGYECRPKNSYLRNGRINVSLNCSREGIEGDIMMTVSGSYTADTIEANVDTTTYLPGRGDFEMRRKLTARRTGDSCAPAEGADGNASGNASGG